MEQEFIKQFIDNGITVDKLQEIINKIKDNETNNQKYQQIYADYV